MLFMMLCWESLRYGGICRCFIPLSISGALEIYGEGPTLRNIEGTTVTGGHTLMNQVVIVASDHIEVSINQDVVPNGEKREICWHGVL